MQSSAKNPAMRRKKKGKNNLKSHAKKAGGFFRALRRAGPLRDDSFHQRFFFFFFSSFLCFPLTHKMEKTGFRKWHCFLRSNLLLVPPSPPSPQKKKEKRNWDLNTAYCFVTKRVRVRWMRKWTELTSLQIYLHFLTSSLTYYDCVIMHNL